MRFTECTDVRKIQTTPSCRPWRSAYAGLVRRALGGAISPNQSSSKASRCANVCARFRIALASSSRRIRGALSAVSSHAIRKTGRREGDVGPIGNVLAALRGGFYSRPDDNYDSPGRVNSEREHENLSQPKCSHPNALDTTVRDAATASDQSGGGV
jgi:hypothetical protein